jgi:hypothetical protein
VAAAVVIAAGAAVAGAAAPGERSRRAALPAALLAALLAGGCAAESAAPAAAPQPSTVPLSATTTLEAPTTTQAAATTPETATSAGSPISGPLTGKERAWLAGIQKLDERLGEIAVVDLATAMTAEQLRSVADRLRGCGGGLARLGRPSGRLRPVLRLAEEACAQYGKAARCLTASGPVERRFDCALSAAAHAQDRFLDAEIKGDEIDVEAG